MPNTSEKGRKELEKDFGKDYLEDGYGNYWKVHCWNCGEKSVEIVRPGKVQYTECNGIC